MFRIVCDPSSGSIELYLTEIIRGGSQMFVVCLVGVWQRNLNPWCVCTVRRTVHTHHGSSTAVYSPMMEHIRSETCWSDF